MSDVPFDRQIWNGQECADYLRQSYSLFMRTTQYRPDFPKRCPVPGHPRWSAKDVMDYARGELDISRQKSAKPEGVTS